MPERSQELTLPARVSLVTLAVRDLPRMAAFFRQFGWPESATNSEHHVAFQCGGAVLALHAAEINVEDAAAVDRAYEAALAADGATTLGEAEDLSFGGRGFVFRDPEGNVWDVIWTDGTSFDVRGGLIFP